MPEAPNPGRQTEQGNQRDAPVGHDEPKRVRAIVYFCRGW